MQNTLLEFSHYLFFECFQLMSWGSATFPAQGYFSRANEKLLPHRFAFIAEPIEKYNSELLGAYFYKVNFYNKDKFPKQNRGH